MMVEVEVRGVLFDMDGVLMSSLGSVERSWHKYAASRGLDPVHAIQRAHGRRAIETVRELRPDLDHHAELRVIEDLEIADNEGLLVYEGVPELLASLPPDAWAIVTSSTERLARSRLAHAGIAVPPRFLTSEMVRQGKPHPEPYERGAELLGIPVGECLVIEDAPAGVAAGKAAGCKVLAVLSTHAPETLADADWRVQSLADVKLMTEADGRLTFRFPAWMPGDDHSKSLVTT